MVHASQSLLLPRVIHAGHPSQLQILACITQRPLPCSSFFQSLPLPPVLSQDNCLIPCCTHQEATYILVVAPLSAVSSGSPLGKAHNRSNPSLSSFLNVVLDTVPILVWFTTALLLPFSVDHRALPFLSPLSFSRCML